MKYKKNILDLFNARLERDKNQFVKDFMVGWAYQDEDHTVRTDEKEKVFYQFYNYTGPSEIELWWDWAPPKFPDFLPDQYFIELMERVTRFDKKVARTAGISYDFDGDRYQRGIARNNAQDYTLANAYPMAVPAFGKRVLDFGAGFGRQACLWNLLEDEDLVFIGVDGIPKSYCQQHFYYSCFDRPLFDYMDDSQEFELNEQSRGNFHLPTWRLDLIPDNYLDKIVAVQVLPELSEELVNFVCSHFLRILKPSGMLYLRDHKDEWQPVHTFDVDQHLLQNGFIKEFELFVHDRVSFHGVPRIFRKK